jgi:hypothetical protein
MTHVLSGAGPRIAPTAESYAVFLVCGEIDAFGHNAVFAQEIGAALAELGLASRIVDYRREIRGVQDALRDENCDFLVCFNGFGSELSLANQTPGGLTSAFGYHGKLLFDLMHDCPSHESMAHQNRVLDGARQVLLTDYGYVQDAHELGFPNVRFVPSITFPLTLSAAIRTGTNRPIQALLPLQLPAPSSVEARFEPGGGYRQRIFREIYLAVTDRCVEDLGLDPRVETRRACREAGVGFEARDRDHRFLLTAILDFTKYARRRALVQGLRGLPVTIVTNAHTEGDLPEGFSTAPARSFHDLLALMAEAACVLCPLPHMTGFHERALGAFSAGAAVLAAPNDIIETQFRHGQEMVIYRSALELAEILPSLLADPERLRAMARSGQEVALDRFSPRRLAETLLSAWQLSQTSPA